MSIMFIKLFKHLYTNPLSGLQRGPEPGDKGRSLGGETNSGFSARCNSLSQFICCYMSSWEYDGRLPQWTRWLSYPPPLPPPSSRSPSSIGASRGTQAWRSTVRLRTANWNTLPVQNCAIVCPFCWISESRVASGSSTGLSDRATKQTTINRKKKEQKQYAGPFQGTYLASRRSVWHALAQKVLLTARKSRGEK